MKTLYSIGAYVSYRQNGIHKIVDITTQKFGRETNQYYILQSVYGDTTQIFVPADTPDLEKHMRPITTRDEIEQIISESEKTELPWYDDSRTRRDFLNNVIASGDRAKILQVLKQLSLHKIKVEKENHKFYATDEALLTRAAKIITEDFAFALGLEKEQVLPYILKIAKK